MNAPSKPHPVGDRDPSAPGDGFSGDEAHLGIAILQDYRAHRLSPEAEARIGEHLLRCAECRELAVDVNAFFDPAEEGEPEPLADPVATWDGVRSVLMADGWFAGQTGRHRRRAMRSLFIAAACLAVAFLGISRFRTWGAEEQILVSAAAYKGSKDEVRVVRLPVRLKLTLAKVEEAPAYRVDLLDLRRARVRTFRGLSLDASGRVDLLVPRWALRPGRYSLELRAEPRNPGETPEIFEIEIRPR